MKKISIAFLILLWLFGGVVSAETLHSSKPNMIFIMADDIGKNILSLPRIKNVIKMPNLERLAAEGVTFKNAYATHLCFSTRVKLLSGRASLNTGAYNNEFPGGSRRNKDFHRVKNQGRTTGFYKYFYDGDSSIHPFIDTQYTPSFALPLKQAGYTNAVVGKWHLNDYVKQPRIFKTFGFDRWMISEGHIALGGHTDKGFIATPGFPPEKLADFVVDFITENKDKPFFVYYPLHLAHHPFVATPLAPDAETTEEKMISMIEYVDLIIGRLIKTLETLNIKDRTIIFFSGDNGDDLDYRLLYELIQGPQKNKEQPFHGKGSLYEGGVNVPLIVSGGPVVKRGETEALVDFTDILPTLADLAGVSVVRKNRENNDDYRGIADRYVSVAELYKGDGYSIAPFLSGQSDDTPRKWMMYSSYGNIVVRNKEFKLWAKIENNKYRGYKLYDLYNDPYEQTNLYSSIDQTILTAKQRIENILNGIPKPTTIDEYFDPVDWNYGMLSHWSMNQSKPTDTESGYNAESDRIILNKKGILGKAIGANRLYAPYSKDLFYNFVVGANDRLFRELRHLSYHRQFPGSRTFYIGVGKIIRNSNKALMEYANTIFNRISPDTYFSKRGDREKFLSGMTVSAWIQTPQPEQDIYILKQPYADKKGNLISFSVTADGTVNFELTTNDKTDKLESKTLDRTLWGQWMHIAATWDGRSECGETILYVNGARVGRACLGKPLSADDTDNLLLGGFAEDPKTNHPETLIDDIALWRQPLMPMQIEALYRLGNRFSYDASQVDALFNTPEEDGTTKIGDQVWHRTELEETTDTDRLMILDFRNEVKVQFGDVMAIETISP